MIGKNISYLVLVTCLAMVSCGSKKPKLDAKFDDSLYELVDSRFYKGKSDQKLYIKTMGLEKANDTSSPVLHYYQEVPMIDIASFSRLQHAGYYAKDKRQVYVWDTSPMGETIQVIEGADPASFTSFGYKWGKDTSFVYYNGKKIKGLDPSLVSPVCFEEMDSSMIYIDFIRDNDQLYYRDEEIKVPADVDLQKIYCKVDLLGNSFLAVGEDLYMVRNGVMVVYE